MQLDFWLDKYRVKAQEYGQFRHEIGPASSAANGQKPESMTSSRPAQSPEMKTDPRECKHPRVRIVAREEDSEFVECLECSEVFESSEFRDMDIEESKPEET